MKKEVLSGIIIGLIIVGGVLGITYYQQQKTQEIYQNTFKGMTNEQWQTLLNQQAESTKDELRSVCNTIITEKNSENGCSQYIKSSDKDICYYCFAVRNQNQSLCEKINDNGWMKMCKEDIGSSTEATSTF